MNEEDKEAHASISFNATFMSFNSHRFSKFEYSTNALMSSSSFLKCDQVIAPQDNTLMPLPSSTLLDKFCGKKDCSFGVDLEKTNFIRCDYGSDTDSQCTYWMHMKCLGFPTLTSENVKLFDHWYCPDHIEVS